MANYYLVERQNAQESLSEPTRTLKFVGDSSEQGRRVEAAATDTVTRTSPGTTTTRTTGPKTTTRTSDGITTTRNGGQRSSTRNIGQRTRSTTNSGGARSGTVTNLEDIGVTLQFRLELKTKQPLVLAT